jgi:hypothetical protein
MGADHGKKGCLLRVKSPFLTKSLEGLGQG